ncbi:hypothetical protein FKP32DRAFT_1596259 [Trametes sanguinea]|nr:hypothetical protein FKP32DRAFT_1596259 [Trametes sanguinea]
MNTPSKQDEWKPDIKDADPVLLSEYVALPPCPKPSTTTSSPTTNTRTSPNPNPGLPRPPQVATAPTSNGSTVPAADNHRIVQLLLWASSRSLYRHSSSSLPRWP